MCPVHRDHTDHARYTRSVKQDWAPLSEGTSSLNDAVLAEQFRVGVSCHAAQKPLLWRNPANGP